MGRGDGPEAEDDGERSDGVLDGGLFTMRHKDHQRLQRGQDPRLQRRDRTEGEAARHTRQIRLVYRLCEYLHREFIQQSTLQFKAPKTMLLRTIIQ